MPPDPGGDDPVFTDGVAVVQVVDQRVGIQGHADGPAHAHIRQIGVFLVQGQVGQAHFGDADDPVPVEGLVEGFHDSAVQGLQVQDVQFAVLEHQVLRAGVGDDPDNGLFDGWGLAPVPVVVFQSVMIVGDPFGHDIRTGADGVGRLDAEG